MVVESLLSDVQYKINTGHDTSLLSQDYIIFNCKKISTVFVNPACYY